MSLTVPIKMLQKADPGPLDKLRENADRWRAETYKVEPYELTDDVLEALRVEGELWGDKSFTRVVGSIQASRRGDFSKPISKISGAEEVLRQYIKHHMIDGWVYRRGQDGHLHPYLVTNIEFDSGRNNEDGPHINFKMVANGISDTRGGKIGILKSIIRLEAEHVTHKTPAAIFMGQSLFIETEELKEEYVAQVERYKTILRNGFSNQYVFTGMAITDNWRSRGDVRTNHKVIHNVAPSEIPSISMHAPSKMFEPDHDSGEVPIHTHLFAFDLRRHDYIWVNTKDIEEYKFDATLRDKLILPDDQQELLDILTTDIGTFAGDIIDGKSSGNVIMCKGVPGVGKTLSAEIYSELISRPLYSIHSGSLGVKADEVRKNLEEVFKRAKRWNAVLLLDEADVFVLERGTDISQNSIVAEFLRTLEYFDGLMFMTTNRSDNIDDAILSRCAAIIDYQLPDKNRARQIWKVQATNNGVVLSEKLLDQLTDGFEDISPRDIKMLLRLALRVAASRNQDLDIDTFKSCSIFRGLHYHKPAAVSSE